MESSQVQTASRINILFYYAAVYNKPHYGSCSCSPSVRLSSTGY